MIVFQPLSRPDQVRDLLDKSYKRAWACLETHRRDLDVLANALMKHETLTGAEINDVLAGRPVKQDAENISHAPAAVSVAKRPVTAATAAATKAAATKATTGATARAAGGASGGGSRGGANTQAKG